MSKEKWPIKTVYAVEEAINTRNQTVELSIVSGRVAFKRMGVVALKDDNGDYSAWQQANHYATRFNSDTQFAYTPQEAIEQYKKLQADKIINAKEIVDEADERLLAATILEKTT